MMRGTRAYLALSWADRVLVAEAVCWLILFRWVLRNLPFRPVHWWLARPSRRRALTGVERARARERVADVVGYAVHRVGVEATCFPRALAAHAMLRRRGVHTRLSYGVRRLPDSPQSLHAHVWLQDGGAGVLGHHAAAELGLRELASLTASAPSEADQCFRS